MSAPDKGGAPAPPFFAVDLTVLKDWAGASKGRTCLVAAYWLHAEKQTF
jgi:hypothetical protein